MSLLKIVRFFVRTRNRTCLIIVVLLAGCYSRPIATKQFGRAAITYPDIPADYCARVYPSKDSILPGTTITKTDTLWGDGETRIDTVFVAGKPIEVTKTIVLPGKVITNTILRTDTIYKVNTAEVDLWKMNARAATMALNTEQGRADKYQARAKKRGLIMWGLISAIGLSFIGWLYLKFRK